MTDENTFRWILVAEFAGLMWDMLADLFGFDKYAEVTSEQEIRRTYCDLAVKLDGAIKFLIEVKAIGLTLKENHLRQAINYGAHQGIPWVLSLPSSSLVTFFRDGLSHRANANARCGSQAGAWEPGTRPP